MLDSLLGRMLALPEGLVLLLMGVFGFLENVVPPVPADVIALFGAFLVAQGGGNPVAAFLCVWSGNVAGALLVYALGRRFGGRFFGTPWGRFLLAPRQMEQLNAVYRRHGAPVMFVSRFLPMFRALVPAFAGIGGLGFWRTAVPIGAASALWYGALVWLGSQAGRNWIQIRDAVETAGQWLAVLAAVLAVALVAWWWRTRSANER